MGRIVYELFTYLKGEDRSSKPTKRNTIAGITSVDSCINIEPDFITGVLKTSRGFVRKIHLGSRTPVWNIDISKDNNGNYRFTGINGGKVYDITNWRSGEFAKTEKGTLADNYTHIVPITKVGDKSYLALLNGDYPYKYDFDTVSQLTNHHKASIGVFVNDRLITNNVEDSARVEGSAAGLPDDFTTTNNAWSLLIGSSLNPITAMESRFIPANRFTTIIVAKENEIHAIYGNSGDSSDASRFQQYEYSKGSVGTTSPRGILSVGSEMFILDKDNIVPFTTLDNQGYLRPVDLSKQIRPLLRNRMNGSYVKNAFMAYIKDEGENGRLYSFAPFIDYERNNQAFVYDFSGGWFRRDFQHYGFTCIAQDPETRQIFVGDDKGYIYEFNTGYNYNGEGYRKILSLGDVDFRLPNVFKTHTARSYIEIVPSLGGLKGLSLEKHDKNGSAIVIDREEISIDKYAATFDDSVFDQSIFDDNRPVKQYLNLQGCFDSTKLIFSNFDKDVDFKINEIYLEADASRGI